MIKETLKNWGEKIVGKDPDSEFKNRYEKHAADHGVSIDEAQKTIFQDVLQDIQDEIKFHGSIDPKSKNFRLFEAAMNGVFSPADLAQFETDAANPLIFSGLSGVPVTTAEYKLSERHYKNKYDGESPGMTVVRDTAESNKALKELMTRFLSDPALGTPFNLSKIMSLRPDLGADLAKIIEIKKQLADHESKFEGQLSFDKSLRSFKGDAKEVLTKKMWGDAGEWLKAVGNSAFNPNFKGVFSLMGATTKFMLKSIWNGSRLLGKMAATTAKFVTKK
jgi:hypothetical protein